MRELILRKQALVPSNSGIEPQHVLMVIVMHLYTAFSFLYILKCGLHQHMWIRDLILPSQPMKTAQRPDPHSGNSMPPFAISVWVMNIEVLWDGLSSLSEKTRKSNHLKTSLQRQHFLSVFECWSGRGLNPRPPARWFDAQSTELTGQYFTCYGQWWLLYVVIIFDILFLFRSKTTFTNFGRKTAQSA